LYCEASDDTMKARLLERGKSSGRVDDNEDSIKQRLETFHQVTQPVIDYYDKKGKLTKVNSEKAPEEVFEEIEEKLFGKTDDFDDGKYINVRPLKNSKVIFVIGGPGSGKVCLIDSN
jgi:hypothetical protein